MEPIQKKKNINIWQKFDVQQASYDTQKERRHLLDRSDRILFNNDPNLTPKRLRDGKIDHALSNTPKPKNHNPDSSGNVNASLSPLRHGPGHVEVPYRQIVHELFTEGTNELDEMFRNIGVTTPNKTPSKWGTPLSRHKVDAMTIDEIDENHKRLQVQINKDYATGMARKSGTHVVQQLIVEDRKRAEEKALRDKWLEHRKRLKNVHNPRIEVKTERKKTVKDKRNRQQNKRPEQNNKNNHNHNSSSSSSTASWSSNSTSRQPVTLLGADFSKPIYGIRRVDDIDEIIERSKKSNVLEMGLDPSAVISRCAEIRKNSVEDLMTLHNGLDVFLKDELAWEEKRHDMKYVLNSRFDMLKKEIDHSVSVGGADYSYDNSFLLDDEDKEALLRIKNSVKARRNKALHTAGTVREDVMRNMMDRRVDNARARLGLRMRKSSQGLVTGADYDQAAADVLEPRTGGVHR